MWLKIKVSWHDVPFFYCFVFLLEYPVIIVSILQRESIFYFWIYSYFCFPSMDRKSSINISSVTGVFFWTVFTAMYIIQRLQQFTYIEFILFDRRERGCVKCSLIFFFFFFFLPGFLAFLFLYVRFLFFWQGLLVGIKPQQCFGEWVTPTMGLVIFCPDPQNKSLHPWATSPSCIFSSPMNVHTFLHPTHTSPAKNGGMNCWCPIV